MFFSFVISAVLFFRCIFAEKTGDSLSEYSVNGIRIANWDEDRGLTTSGGHIHAVLKTLENSREKTIASLKDQLDSMDDIRIVRVETSGFMLLLKNEIDFVAWSGDDKFDGIKNVPMTFFVLGKMSALQKKCVDSSDFSCFSFDPKVHECRNSGVDDKCHDVYKVPENSTPVYSKNDVINCVFAMALGWKDGFCKIELLNEVVLGM